jgi:Lrp/AsnC family transcriptional regulator
MTDTLDLIDRKIIAELMRDATLPIAQIADRVGLSQTPCWKRIQKLEAAGVLTGRVALADPARIGLGLTVFVGIEAPDHTVTWRDAFATKVEAMPEIMEVWRMAGELDYLLRIAVPDMTAYDAFYKRLTDAVPIKNLTSRWSGSNSRRPIRSIPAQGDVWPRRPSVEKTELRPLIEKEFARSAGSAGQIVADELDGRGEVDLR